MQDWKRPIIARLGLPNLSESLFNEAWDAISDELKSALTNDSSADRQFLHAIFQCASWEPTAVLVPPKAPEAARCAALMEYGNANYTGLLDKNTVNAYTAGKCPSTPEQRKANVAAVEKLLANCNEYAFLYVAYGYDVSPIPEDLNGRAPKDAFKRIEWLNLICNAFNSSLVESSIYSFRWRYGFLSNFYQSPVRFDGRTYPSVECAFQAAKTLSPDERKQFETMDSSAAKRAGRSIVLRSDWESVKVAIMRSLLLDKFEFGSEPYKQLKATAPSTLVEGNTWHDNFWGDCSCPKCHAKPGRNVLGNLLMEIRDMPAAKLALESCVKDRYAVILPFAWYTYLCNNPSVLNEIMNIYPCTGVLCQYNQPATLYHITSDLSTATSILDNGFKVNPDNYAATYGGDVVYAYPTLDPFESAHGVIMRVTVNRHMRAVFTQDKDVTLQHECIFDPDDVTDVQIYKEV